jgi:hypothetical protein
MNSILNLIIRKSSFIVAAILFGFLAIWLGLLFIIDINIMKYLCPAMYPIFADLSTVTYSVDAINKGLNPYFDTSTDPFGRRFNYPSLILLIFNFLNLNGASTIYLGIGILILFLLGISFLLTPKIKSIKVYLFYFLILLSPAMFLLMERCNIDILIFLLILAAISLPYNLKKTNLFLKSIKYSLLLFASAIKLYPIFSIICLIIGTEKYRIGKYILFGTIILFSIYLFKISNEVKLITEATPQSAYASYGKNILFEFLFENKKFAILMSWFVVLTGIIFASFDYLNKLIIENNNEEIDNSIRQKKDFFIAGASIFLGSFILGNNFEYRLVFLLFCLPLLFHYWEIKKNITIVKVILVAMILRVWQYLPFNYFSQKLKNEFLSDSVFTIEQICSWVIFFGIFRIFIEIIFQTKTQQKIKSISGNLKRFLKITS